MNMYKSTIALMICLILLLTNLAFANDKEPSVKFFASNNTKEITLQMAYARLTGVEQSLLRKSMIGILKERHIDRVKFENILGTYRMSTDKNMTADNTVDFNTNQRLTDDKVFSIAKVMAINLNQDSVAVFIPKKSSIADVVVSFSSHQPKINEIVRVLHEKLSARYNQAFSLQLVSGSHDFEKAKVAQIEWLGSKLKLQEIKKAFPFEKINAEDGKVFLVYKDGHKEGL